MSNRGKSEGMMIKCEAFIFEDTDEWRIKLSCNYENYMQLQRVNRGIIVKNKGGEILNIRAFAQYCIEKRIAVFRTENGNRYAYNNIYHMYEFISENTLGAMLLSIMEEYSQNIFDMKSQAETIRYIDMLCRSYKTLPTSYQHLIFPNGTYDLFNKKFLKDFWDRDIINTFVMPYEYNANAECNNFLKFIEDIFNGDEDVIKVVQEIFGYTFCYGQAPIDKFFYFYSTGRSGKSVLTNILRKLHGGDRVSALPLENLEQRFQLATLVGKAVNITPEGSQNKLLNTGILKALTGRDAVLIEEKYKVPYTVTLYTKLIVVSNHFINVNDDSFGFWQRILPIHFPNIYVPLPINGKRKKGTKYQNLNLEAELETKLSGIFNWAMEGLSRLSNNEWVFTYSQAIEDFKNKLMLLNKPVEIFVSECIEEADPMSKIKCSVVHEIFKEWAVVNEINIYTYYDSRKFHQEFKACLQSQSIAYEVKKRSVDFYYGIRFNEEIIEND